VTQKRGQDSRGQASAEGNTAKPPKPAYGRLIESGHKTA
jgi:hypothetical protein